MSSKVVIDDVLTRPSFNHRSKNRVYQSSLCELVESSRNVLEDIQKSQMLQCDVAHAIKFMSLDIADIAKTLRRIDRRLAKKISL